MKSTPEVILFIVLISATIYLIWDIKQTVTSNKCRCLPDDKPEPVVAPRVKLKPYGKPGKLKPKVSDDRKAYLKEQNEENQPPSGSLL